MIDILHNENIDYNGCSGIIYKITNTKDDNKCYINKTTDGLVKAIPKIYSAAITHMKPNGEWNDGDYKMIYGVLCKYRTV